MIMTGKNQLVNNYLNLVEGFAHHGDKHIEQNDNHGCLIHSKEESADGQNEFRAAFNGQLGVTGVRGSAGDDQGLRAGQTVE